MDRDIGGYGLRATGYGLRATGYGLAGYRLKMNGNKRPDRQTTQIFVVHPRGERTGNARPFLLAVTRKP